MSTIHAIFPAADFLRLAAFTINEPYLRCVNVEPTSDAGCVMVATNGKILGTYRHAPANGTCTSPVMVSTAKDILRAMKGGRKECLYAVCRAAGLDIVIADSAEAAATAPAKVTIPADTAYLSGLTFPAWRKVLPEKQSGTRRDQINEINACFVSIDHDLLAPFAAFGRFISFDWNGTGPIAVVSNDPAFYGVVMPARGGQTPDEITARQAYVTAAP
jgi:hypothetical protein